MVSKDRCTLKHRTRPGESKKSMDCPTFTRAAISDGERDRIKSPLCWCLALGLVFVSISISISISINISVSFRGSIQQVVSRVPAPFVLRGGESNGGRKMSPIQNLWEIRDVLR